MISHLQKVMSYCAPPVRGCLAQQTTAKFRHFRVNAGTSCDAYREKRGQVNIRYLNKRAALLYHDL